MSDNQPQRILIAEDERAYSRALVLKLQNAGFEVESVENGEEALEVIKKNNFDLLLCDLVMPKMNGFHVIEEIKKKGLKIPLVMVLTNLSQEEDEEKARSLGVREFIIKSNTTIADVVERIKNVLK